MLGVMGVDVTLNELYAAMPIKQVYIIQYLIIFRNRQKHLIIFGDFMFLKLGCQQGRRHKFEGGGGDIEQRLAKY